MQGTGLFRKLPLFLFALLVAACVSNIDDANINMHWQPVDSLNAALPEGICVFAGEDDALPLRAWYVRVEEGRPEIVTRVLMSDDKSDNRETVSSFARDESACVVINGGYFNMSRTPSNHAGLLVCDGKILSRATRSVLRDSLRYQTARATLGFTSADEVHVAWVTTRSDSLFTWTAPPQHAPGRPAPELDYSEAQHWNIRDAVAAGPALIVDGKIKITSDEEVFFGTTIPNVHPRTAAGITSSGDLILMVVDGRQMTSRGVSLEELASLMLEVGAVEALNLDGGGSSALVVNHMLLNHPAGGTTEREVMSAIAVFCAVGNN